MIKRLVALLRWIPNAPTGITELKPGSATCDYCGAGTGEPDNGLTNYQDVFCICHKCRKRVADAVLSDTVTAPQEEHAGGRDAASEFGNTLAGKKL